MIRMRSIKPARFKEEAFRQSFRWAADETIKDADKQFAKTYATFSKKPKFRKEHKETATEISASTSTDDENYVRLDKGVKGGYPIPKAGPGILAFRSGYKAKTSRGVLGSQSGGSYGNLIIRKTQIIHPGFKGREFEKTVAIYEWPLFKRRGDIAMKRGVKASGHAI